MPCSCGSLSCAHVCCSACVPEKLAPGPGFKATLRLSVDLSRVCARVLKNKGGCVVLLTCHLSGNVPWFSLDSSRYTLLTGLPDTAPCVWQLLRRLRHSHHRGLCCSGTLRSGRLPQRRFEVGSGRPPAGPSLREGGTLRPGGQTQEAKLRRCWWFLSALVF